ncbi:MAG TPA: TolC family protein [Gammaproteobacteria bacterium]|jgi:TolC family type I secretion outer membrane protein
MPQPPIQRSVIAALACLTAVTLTVGAGATDAAIDPPHFGQPLTLVQLTDLALSNNPATKIAWAEVRSSDAGVELARAGYWPQVSLAYDYERQRTPTGISGTTAAETLYGPSVDISWLLFDFGTRSGNIDAAKFNRTAQELDANQTLQDLILEVEQDYYQVIGLQAVQEADLQSVQDASANLENANQRKNSGLNTIGDVYQAEAALAGTRLTLQTAQGQLAVARGTLAIALGYPADTDVPLAVWEKELNAKMPEQNIHDLLDRAAKARPELLAAKAQQQAAIASLEATRGRGWPTLSLDGSAGRTTTDIQGVHSTVNNYQANLTLSIPLFTGFANQAANRQAEAAVDVANATDEQLIQAVQLEVWQAYQNTRTAVSNLDTADLQLKSSQQAADVVQARYKNGLDSILDVLSAQATLANARVQQVQARLNWFAALAAMGHALGGLDVPKDKVQLP